MEDADASNALKARRTGWGQSVHEGKLTSAAPSASNVNSTSTPAPITTEPADPRSAAAAAAALLVARQQGAAAAQLLTANVAARAAAARAVLEKAKRALALKRQLLQQQQQNAGNGSRYDALGRELDAEGNVLEIKPVIHTTLKVNMNRIRENRLKTVKSAVRAETKIATKPTDNPWFDPALRGAAALKARKKKPLCFVEKGYYVAKERQLLGRAVVEAQTGLNLSAKALEEQKKREEEESRRYRVLLKYQKRNSGCDDSQLNNRYGGKPSANNDDGDPNDVPLGGYNADYGTETSSSHMSLHVLQQKRSGLVPDMEWWDAPLLQRLKEESLIDDPVFPYFIRADGITNLVEHDVPVEPVVDPLKPAPALLLLTPKERATLRRRRRQDKEQDKRDKVRMGLMEPPPPKVRLANMHRVLGKDAAANPSKTEKEVRRQLADRLKGHEERNEARRLDENARKQKTIAKYTKQPANLNAFPPGGSFTAVYFIVDLTSRPLLIKVDKNAQQLHVTGAAILTPSSGNLIIVEGMPKSLKAYKRLLLHRIKWAEDIGEAVPHLEVPAAVDEAHQLVGEGNEYCRLLWEGVVQQRHFKDWRVHVFRTEAEATRLLFEKGVEHYWELLKKCRANLNCITEFDSKIRDVFIIQRRERQNRHSTTDVSELHFPKETIDIREDDDWTITEMDPASLKIQLPLIDLGDVDPSDLDRFALAFSCPSAKTGVTGVQVDFDDGFCPTWGNVLRGHSNVKKFCENLPSKHFPMLRFRPRSWNMVEENILVHGRIVFGALLDFALHLFHNAKNLADAFGFVYLYLPKLESYHEARIWSEIIRWAEKRLRLQPSTVRVIVLIETVPAAFEMDEILYELRSNILGLNTGIWDYCASFVTRFPNSRTIFPDRNRYVSQESDFLKMQRDLMVAVCHRRKALATTGMFAKLGISASEACDVAKRADAAAGADGCLVYDLDHGNVARRSFLAVSTAWPRNQCLITRLKSQRGRAQLRNTLTQYTAPGFMSTSDATSLSTSFPTPVSRLVPTQAGFYSSLEVTYLFILSWLLGRGHFILRDQVEDSATAEICRAQLWQLLRYEVTLQNTEGLETPLSGSYRILSGDKEILQKPRKTEERSCTECCGMRAATLDNLNSTLERIRSCAERKAFAGAIFGEVPTKALLDTAEHLCRDLVTAFEAPLFMTSWLQEKRVLQYNLQLAAKL